MSMEAFWDLRSREHIAKHGVSPDEVDYVLQQASAPFPQDIGEGKHLVQGQTEHGRYLQVIIIYRPIDTIDWEMLDWQDRLRLLDEGLDEVVYVVHARELTDAEKRNLRRRIQ